MPIAYYMYPKNLQMRTPSEKKTYTNNYDEVPILEVTLTIDSEKIFLHGLIDTGSTNTIISKKIADKYFTIDESKPIEMNAANGIAKIYLIGKKTLSIPNYHRINKGFNVEVYSTEFINDKITDTGEVIKIDIILGLSFLKECVSFWMDAQNKVYSLEFYS